MTIEQAHQNLFDSIQRVAEAARDLSDGASQNRDVFVIVKDDMRDLREALQGWTEASNAYLAAVQEDAQTFEPCDECGRVAHESWCPSKGSDE